MPEKSWKVTERKVARVAGGERTPLSGRGSKHTSADVIHPWLFIEVRSRRRIAVLSLMKEIEQRAQKEGKIPTLVLQQCNAKHRYWLFREDFAKQLLRAYEIVYLMPEGDPPEKPDEEIGSGAGGL